MSTPPSSSPSSSRPIFEELVIQMTPISASWEQFAIHLGFNFEKISIIRRDEPHGVTNQLSMMLSQWLENNPSGTWKDIVKALRSMRWHELADKTESKYINETVVCPGTPPSYKIDDIQNCIDAVFDRNYSRLSQLFEGGMKSISLELFSVGVITNDVQKDPTFDSIISCFRAGFAFKSEMAELEEYCRVFFKSFYKVGGPFRGAADKLKSDIVQDVKEKFGIEMRID